MSSKPSKGALEQALYDAWRSGFETGCAKGLGYEDAGPDMVTDVAHIARETIDQAERRGLERAVNACVARARALRDFGDGCDGDVKNLRDGANVLDDMAARLRALIEGGSDDRQR